MKNGLPLRRPVELVLYVVIGGLAFIGFMNISQRIIWSFNPPISVFPPVPSEVPVPFPTYMTPVPSGPSQPVGWQPPVAPLPAEPNATSTIYFSGCQNKEIFYVKDRPARLKYSPEPMTLAEFKKKYPSAVPLTVEGENRLFVSVFCDQQARGYITLEQRSWISVESRPIFRLYRYDPRIKELEQIAWSPIMPAAAPIPIVSSVSEDGEFIALRGLGCYDCDAGPGLYIPLHPKSRTMLVLVGRFAEQAAFEWLGTDGKFRYKELVQFEGPCPPGRFNDFMGDCPKNETEVPFIYGQLIPPKQY